MLVAPNCSQKKKRKKKGEDRKGEVCHGSEKTQQMTQHTEASNFSFEVGSRYARLFKS